MANATMKKLQRAGFNMQKLTIVRHHSNVDEPAVAQVIDSPAGLDEEKYACIPGESIRKYEEELNADRMLIVAHGTEVEIAQARNIIDTDHPEGWNGRVGCAVYYGCDD